MDNIFSIVNGQIDVIAIKRNGRSSSVNANILPIGCQHVEISPKPYIAFGSGNVSPLRNLLPLPITNAILTIKSNFGCSDTDCLRTVGVIEPHHPDSKNDQQQNTCRL
jgi:hypothetical protein